MAASFFHGSCRRRLAFKCQNGPASGRHCRCRHVGSTAGTTAVTTTRCDVRLSVNASRRSLARRLFVIFFCALPFAVNVTFRPPIRSGVPLHLPAPWCRRSSRFGEFTSFTFNTQRGRVSSHRLLENFASLQQRQRRLL